MIFSEVTERLKVTNLNLSLGGLTIHMTVMSCEMRLFLTKITNISTNNTYYISLTPSFQLRRFGLKASVEKLDTAITVRLFQNAQDTSG